MHISCVDERRREAVSKRGDSWDCDNHVEPAISARGVSYARTEARLQQRARLGEAEDFSTDRCIAGGGNHSDATTAPIERRGIV